jgi:hypothetical protein
MWWLIGSLLGIGLDKSTKEERARKRAQEWKDGWLYFIIAMAIISGLCLWAWHWLVLNLP